MQCYSTEILESTWHTTTTATSSTSFSTPAPSTAPSSVSSASSVSSGTHESSSFSLLSLASKSIEVHGSEGGIRSLRTMGPLRKETAEEDILHGIMLLAVMLDRKEDLDESLNKERDRLASGIEDAKVLLGLHLCRIEDDLTREVLLKTFLLHLGPTDAPWMLAPLLARLATGV